MNIHIEYFASLREQRGLARETVAATDPDARGLYASLRRQHGFTLTQEHLRVAVNDDFCAWDRPLADGDRVVFLPPVAGG